MKYISKRFLSDDQDETGSIVVKVEGTTMADMGRWNAENVSVNAEVTFRDCHGKPIYLQFCLDKEHSLDSRFDKVNLIIAELEKLKVQLRKAFLETEETAKLWLEAHPQEKDDETFP